MYIVIMRCWPDCAFLERFLNTINILVLSVKLYHFLLCTMLHYHVSIDHLQCIRSIEAQYALLHTPKLHAIHFTVHGSN